MIELIFVCLRHLLVQTWIKDRILEVVAAVEWAHTLQESVPTALQLYLDTLIHCLLLLTEELLLHATSITQAQPTKEETIKKH